MSDWELVESPSKGSNAAYAGEWELAPDEEESEGLGKSLLYAGPRIAKDLGVGLWHGIKKIPKIWESGKTEIPGLWDLVKNHKAHAAMQALAGMQEAINALNHIPSGLAQYANKRLHLLPHQVPEFIERHTPDTTESIQQLFGTPQFAGEKLLRGTTRNLPALIPGTKVASTLGRGINNLRPRNALRGNLMPEELRNNLRITQDTETGLGDVIGSPFLKRMNENVLSKIPFSGANEAMQRNAGKIIDRGNMLMESLKGKGNVENVDKYLNDALKYSYESHLGEKNALYKQANQIAKDSGLQLELPTFAQEAKKYREAIEDTNILKYEPELQSLLRKVSGYESPIKTNTKTSNIVDEFGRPFEEKTTKFPSLEEANLLKGKLNQLSRQHGASSSPTDRHLAGVFGKLARNLKGDIEGAIESSGNEPLKAAYKLAEENYGKKFSPFLDKEIYKFINGNADPETLINAFVKTGKSNDRAELINKLVSKLPMEDRNLLGYRYLQRAMDENNVLNPLKLKTLLSRNALGPKQLEALFPNPVLRNALRDYVNLVDMNTKGLKLMQNPETGQMNMDILPLLSKGPKSLAGKMLVAPMVAKKLTSEKTRTKLVNKMAKVEAGKKAGKKLKPLELTLIGGHRKSDEE